MSDLIEIYRTYGGKSGSDFLIDYILRNLDDGDYEYDEYNDSLTIDRAEFLNFIGKRFSLALSNEAKVKSLNSNLLRISKERANSDRGLKPKKEHDGFVVLSFSSRFERVYTSNRDIENVLVFKTIMQTPYSQEFNYDSVRDRVWSDIPFDCQYYAKPGKNNINNILLKYEDVQYVYRWNLRLNNISSDSMSYWEIELNHTKPFDFNSRRN